MFGIKTTLADKEFSLFIRDRAEWTCERCYVYYEPPNRGLQCSHFHGRGNKGTRFDPENAAALCYGCHRYFTANPQEHAEWFLKRLGQTKYDSLRVRAKTPTKVDESLILMGLKAMRQELRKPLSFMPRRREGTD